jgi:hypothetical protein
MKDVIIKLSTKSYCFYCRTLYCAKGNYEFGISRVIKSLEPYNKKLGTDTWYYAKRCFLSLIENMAKHMIMMKDQVIQECIGFLECCIYKAMIKIPVYFTWHMHIAKTNYERFIPGWLNVFIQGCGE